jgi:twitching motility protein PilU
MQTFDQALLELYQAGKIDYDEALRNADSQNELRLQIKLSSGEDRSLSGLSLHAKDEDEDDDEN